MREAGGVIEYDYAEIRDGLKDGSILLVDVREPHEFAAGHIPGAVLFPLSTFDPAALPEPSDGQALVFQCRTGGRTLKAIAASQQAGLPYRAHYKGSFTDWVQQGAPVAFGEPL